MPNWKTHLEIGKKLLENLNFNETEKQLFLLGSILPDINNCYIVQNISLKLRHSYTHFDSEDAPSYVNFKKKYKRKIKKNPILYGYYAHLYTDYMWNNDFYTKCEEKHYKIKDADDLRIIKQHDFRYYNNKFMDNILHINNYDNAIKEASIIDRISINIEDLSNVIEYIENSRKWSLNLNFYTIEELDELFDKTIEAIRSEKL